MKKLDKDRVVKSITNNRIKPILLKEKFGKFEGNNLAKCFEWDEPVGKEINADLRRIL